ncbi:phage tail sheath family protein [Phormidesmis sp. 146-12]
MALDYFAPGVYVEEVDRGSRPIEGVSLSVAGFVGFTEDIRGGAEQFKPMLVTSWDQYLQYFGKPGSTGFAGFPGDPAKVDDPKAKKDFFFYLPFAVDGWFKNGGGRCWVVSIGRKPPIKGYEEPSPNGIKLLLHNASKKPSLVFKFKAPATPAPAADSTPATPADPNAETPATPQLPPAPAPRPLLISIQPDEPLDGSFDTGEFFKIVVRDDEEVLEEHSGLTMRQGVDAKVGSYVITKLADATNGSKLITVELPTDVTALTTDTANPAKAITAAIAQRPTSGTHELVPPPESLDPATWTQELQGVRKKKTGVQGIFEVDEVAMISCPDLMLALQQSWLGWDQVKGFMELMIGNCENAFPSPAFRMAVIDAPPMKGEEIVSPKEHTPQDVDQWLSSDLNRRSQFAALYYPWIEVANPGDNGKPIFVPPSGHMMGIWARVDQERGVFKAPANETPRGVLGLAYEVNIREQELLNPKGINCIRNFSTYTRGYKVWGARTLVEPDNIQWRYISVRRLMSYIAKSIEMGTQWVVFEPNDQDLWARVNRTVSNFLEGLWRQGALFGGSPAEAFYVKCDATINTPDTIMKGRLYIEIGVAPVRPAEFVIFQISQWSPNQ